MAEESGGDSWWGVWGSEFLSNVKAKSAETLSLVKQDLSEFVTTIQHDTAVTAAETAQNVKEKLKVDEDETDGSTTAVIRQGVSQWFGSISTALRENISQLTAVVDDEPTSSQPGPVFDRAQAKVHEIQTAPATYCNDPDGHPAQYEDWFRGFDLELQKPEISELLVNKPEIRSLYTKLVPTAVTHSLFWTRYFYKMHRFEQEEKRKAALVERATKMEEDIGWDDEDESWDVEEASSKDILLHQKSTRTESESPDQEHLASTKTRTESGSLDEEHLASTKTRTESGSLDEEHLASTKTRTESGSLDKEYLASTKTHLSHQKEERPEGQSITKEVQPDLVHTQENSEEAKIDQTLIKDIQPHEHVTTETQSSLENDLGKDRGTGDSVFRGTGDSVFVVVEDALHPSTVTEEERKPPAMDDEPRESSTPNPCPDETPQTPSKHKRTASNGESEGNDDLNRENSSNSSVDSSWSKISEEELKQNNSKKNIKDGPRSQDGHSPSHSEVSSSSVVVVPAIQDKDLDWDDDDDDLDFGITQDDRKKDDTKLNNDDDDDDWENWE